MNRFSVSPGCEANVDELLNKITELENDLEDAESDRDKYKDERDEAQAALSKIEDLAEDITNQARRYK